MGYGSSMGGKGMQTSNFGGYGPQNFNQGFGGGYPQAYQRFGGGYGPQTYQGFGGQYNLSPVQTYMGMPSNFGANFGYGPQGSYFSPAQQYLINNPTPVSPTTPPVGVGGPGGSNAGGPGVGGGGQVYGGFGGTIGIGDPNAGPTPTVISYPSGGGPGDPTYGTTSGPTQGPPPSGPGIEGPSQGAPPSGPGLETTGGASPAGQGEQNAGGVQPPAGSPPSDSNYGDIDVEPTPPTADLNLPSNTVTDTPAQTLAPTSTGGASPAGQGEQNAGGVQPPAGSPPSGPAIENGGVQVTPAVNQGGETPSGGESSGSQDSSGGDSPYDPNAGNIDTEPTPPTADLNLPSNTPTDTPAETLPADDSSSSSSSSSADSSPAASWTDTPDPSLLQFTHEQNAKGGRIYKNPVDKALAISRHAVKNLDLRKLRRAK